MRRLLGAAVLPLLAALVLTGGVLLASPRDDVRPPTPAPVAGTSYACPVGDGLTQATGQARPDARDDDDRRDWTTTEADGDALVVRHRGRGAGAVGFVSGVLDEDDGGGLVVGPCSGIVDDAWFTGLGSSPRHASRLVLTNLADRPAVAEVTLWGPQGQVATADDAGLVVEPGETLDLPLADLAAGEPDLAVRVERRRGALAVNALDTSADERPGSELVEAAAGPRRTQVLAGVPAGARGRVLRILNPGGTAADVDVEVLGEDGPFVPEGLEEVRVGAGRTTTVEVPRSVGAAPVAVRLRSSVPVVGAVLAQPSGEDGAVSEPAPALTGPAVVPIELGTSTDRPGLVLTAIGAAGTARVVAHAADGTKLDQAAVDVPAGSTLAVDLAGDDAVLDVADAAYVVLEAEGTLVGAATYAAGDRVASLVLRPAPVTVLAPQVDRAP